MDMSAAGPAGDAGGRLEAEIPDLLWPLACLVLLLAVLIQGRTIRSLRCGGGER